MKSPYSKARKSNEKKSKAKLKKKNPKNYTAPLQQMGRYVDDYIT